jgi:hypothetical protein
MLRPDLTFVFEQLALPPIEHRSVKSSHLVTVGTSNFLQIS